MGFASKFMKRAEAPEATTLSETLDGLLRTEKTEDEIVFYLGGKLDVTSVEETKNAILEAIDTLPVALDFEKTTFMSSAGMRMLFEVKKACDAGNVILNIRNIPPNIYNMLRRTGYCAILNLKVLEDE